MADRELLKSLWACVQDTNRWAESALAGLAHIVTPIKFREETVDWLGALVYRIAFMFDRLADGRRYGFELDEMAGGVASLEIVAGAISVTFYDPYRDFLEALKGPEADRINRCPVCRKIFFAMRHRAGSKYGSKACSSRCNQTLRVRHWREKQPEYEQTRKINEHNRELRESGAWLGEKKK
jgi:hypothetical protein